MGLKEVFSRAKEKWKKDKDRHMSNTAFPTAPPKLADIDMISPEKRRVPNPFVHILKSDRLVKVVAFSPDGKYVVTGDIDGTVKIWNPYKGTCLRTLGKQGDEQVTQLAFSACGSRLAVCQHQIVIWETETWGVLDRVLNDSGFKCALFMQHRGAMLLALTNSAKLYLWNTEGTLTLVHECQTDFRDVNKIAISQDESILVLVQRSGQLAFLDLSNLKHWVTIKEHVVAHTQSANAVVFSVDGKQLATAGADSMVKVWNYYELIKGRAKFAGIRANWYGSVNHLTFSTQGDLLIMGGYDENLSFVDTENESIARSIKTQNAIYSFALSPCQRLLICNTAPKEMPGISEFDCSILDFGNTNFGSPHPLDEAFV